MRYNKYHTQLLYLHAAIMEDYVTGKYTSLQLARKHNCPQRQVWKAANRYYAKPAYDLTLPQRELLETYSKIVLNMESGVYYDSIRQAAAAHNIPHGQFWFNVRRRKSAYKFAIV